MPRIGGASGVGGAGFEDGADGAADAVHAPTAEATIVRGTAARRPAPGTTGTTTAATTPRSLPISKGATVALDRATFEKLSRRDDVPGALGVREVKFLMTGVDTASPQLYLINTNGFAYHYDFATKALGVPLSLEEFNGQTYFKDQRKFLAGTIIAHDEVERNGKKGVYAMEVWPTDPVKAEHVAKAYKAVTDALPFAKGQVAYHPAGDTQEALFTKEKAKLTRLGVSSVTTESLMKDRRYAPLNAGEGYGVLRVVDGQRPGERPPGIRDVVIFKTIPNDLSHVGGVITEQPQTPLSHVNLKAKQNDTPNAYVKDASKDPKIAALVGKLVHYKVGPDGYVIEAATEAEAARYLESVRPKKVQHPPRDLRETKIRDLDDLANASTKAYGAKASNLGELRNILPANVPDGYAIPFSFYDKFMKANGLYDAAKRMQSDPKFQSDPTYREAELERFRRRMRDAEVPAELKRELTELQRKFPADQGIRCRSSTNNEDLPGFNGAGLYDSYTHRPDEGTLDRTVKQVWASLWNFRAFEEREFYRIPHEEAAMGVAVIPNFDDERANGVAVTKNIYDPNWPGFYVNVQVGEELVTNPTAGATPDEFLISAIGERGEYETQFVRHSSETRAGKPVMTKAQTDELTRAMEKIQEHFKKVYKKEGDKSFGMDIEFKIDERGKLVVKQARPYVD